VATHAELEARILADPDDAEAYLVYGDWLQARGDPRGELIAVQHRLANETSADELRARERELVGELMPLDKGSDIELDWRLGFVHTLRIRRAHSGGLGDLRKLFEHRCLRFLRALEIIGGVRPPVFDALRSARFETVGRVAILPDPEGAPGAPLMWLRRLPALRELRLEGHDLPLDHLDHPEVRVLVARVQDREVELLRRARLPKLERLELDLRRVDGPEAARVALGFGVRHLALRGAADGDGTVAALVGARLGGLESLDLRGAVLSEDAAHTLAAALPGTLRALDLRGTQLGAAVAEALAAGGRFVESGPESAGGEPRRAVHRSPPPKPGL
jgi:uncharacterized protein (TIGR02996 family)